MPDLFAQPLHQLLRFLPLLLAGQVLDRDPGLQLRRLDHVEERDAPAGMGGATRSIVDGDLKFLGFVDDDEEYTRIRGLFH